MRKWYHLNHNQDQKMIDTCQVRYQQMSEERRKEVSKFVVSNPEICFGKPRLIGTRSWIELIVADYLHDDLFCYTNEFNEEDLIDIITVWFFEDWLKNPDYNKKDYVE